MLIGYARISKADGSQSLDLQRDALREAGASRKMGTGSRRAGCRGSNQEDEDPLGDVQQGRPPNLAES